MQKNRVPMRINRVIAASGYCSRRSADRMIAAGRVFINGQPAEPGMLVCEGDTVAADGTELSLPEDDFVYLALNKPAGITCTSNPAVSGNIIDLVGYPRHLFTVGRLDRDSRGLILLTNDGETANRIIRARYGHEKEYAVTVDRPVTSQFIRALRKGIPILDTVTRPCPAWKTGSNTFGIILKQGLNRQIRRMCSALNHRVTDLQRTRIMHITLDGLEEGVWRALTLNETDELLRRTTPAGTEDQVT